MIREPTSWKKAKESCISIKSQLVTISSFEENKFVASIVDNFTWIGAQWNEALMNYTWVDGATIGFNTMWNTRKNDSSLCVAICQSNEKNQCSVDGNWYQVDCINPNSFVCEKTGKW